LIRPGLPRLSAPCTESAKDAVQYLPKFNSTPTAPASTNE
jgi:hypothetical protein